MLQEELENIDLKLVKDLVYTNPLPLLTVKSPEVIAYVNSLLPFSTGFEIECDYGADYREEAFKSIPYIMEVNNSSWEQRYRIPNGFAGFVCLYLISDQLKRNSAINQGSGIHYHIDMTDCFHRIKNNTQFIDANRNWILEELDTWNYKGKYNHRDVNLSGAKWLRFSYEWRTAEFRCGEMTFNYSELVKNIIHANDIIRRVKNLLVGSQYVEQKLLKTDFIVPDVKKVKEFFSLYSGNNKQVALNRLKQAEAVLKEKVENFKQSYIVKETPKVDIASIIKARNKKM